MARSEDRSLHSRQRTDTSGRVVENGILQGIPDQEYKALRPYLEFVSFEMRQVLQDPGERIEFGFFLNSGLASLLVVTSDARSVEVGLVGREGFVGAPLAVGLRDSSQRVIMQVPGSAFRVKSQVLENVLANSPELGQGLNRYVLVQGMQTAQLAACNRLHEIDQRLARWLLMSHDRVGNDSFPITHDFLAQMLGCGRPSVTLAAGNLQRAGIIVYTRGQVKILSRKRLEHSSCECYDAILRINGYHGRN